jgi:hypothetical protein
LFLEGPKVFLSLISFVPRLQISLLPVRPIGTGGPRKNTRPSDFSLYTLIGSIGLLTCPMQPLPYSRQIYPAAPSRRLRHV